MSRALKARVVKGGAQRAAKASTTTSALPEANRAKGLLSPTQQTPRSGVSKDTVNLTCAWACGELLERN